MDMGFDFAPLGSLDRARSCCIACVKVGSTSLHRRLSGGINCLVGADVVDAADAAELSICSTAAAIMFRFDVSPMLLLDMIDDAMICDDASLSSSLRTICDSATIIQ